MTLEVFHSQNFSERIAQEDVRAKTENGCKKQEGGIWKMMLSKVFSKSYNESKGILIHNKKNIHSRWQLQF